MFFVALEALSRRLQMFLEDLQKKEWNLKIQLSMSS
jgi:hypothetical protein